ncbi:type III secretion system gatekeeper subunit SctW [Brenneria uluponensis]|uniref:type III secretion system gatekeeper subunit SctW n=1 Tax=Brenneria uluponensis TaxID=3057057 RepID=UPI0028EFBA1A|nr:type III secretion system gatekeeper subunit SctW [Brenneria ulupoensis]
MITIPSISSALNTGSTPITHDVDNQESVTTPEKTSAPHVTHAASSLHDSMEEVSMTFGEQVERKSKALNRRQITQPESRLAANVERIEKLTELFHLLENPKQPTLDQQILQMKALLNQSEPPTVEAIIATAGGDAARADIVLRHVINQTQTQDATLSETATHSLTQLHQEKGPEVRAGLNTAASISLFSTDPNHKQALRELYYQKIVHQQSTSSLLDALLERFDSQHFAAGLRTLQRALAADIASLAPSISKSILSKMLGNLNDSRHLSHTLSSSQSLLSRLAAKLPDCTLNAVELTRRLIGLSANGAYVRDLHNLGREIAGQDPHRQVLFFNALLPLISELPHPLWRDSKNRQTALQLIKGLIGDFAQYEKQMNDRAAK